jgi:CubicO group peptidase (beta-lactamase class C family)
MRPRSSCLALLLLIGLCGGPAAAQSTFPPDSVVQALLDDAVADGRSAAVAVALIEPDRTTRFLTAGNPGPGRTLGPQSVFEIGSITKVFTGVLLADMALRREVALDDPVAKYLPEGVTMPSRNGRQITLAQLSMQNSGLPRLPDNMRPRDPLNPYADYSDAQLYEFLGGHVLQRDPGQRYEYSNLGVGLLGHVLALRAGKSYEQLVKERILDPLGMAHTVRTLTPWMRERVVAGHNASGDTVPLWDLVTLAGAGALRSTTEDMVKFALAALHGGDDAVHQAIALAMASRAEAASPLMRIGLGWHRRQTSADTIVWHNGGTGGFRSFLGVVPATGRGVVLMSSTAGGGLDDIAFHLLDPRLPLAPPVRQAVAVPTTVLARYVGVYQLAPQFSIEVTLVDGVLRAQPTAQPAIRLWPESETRFFIREVDAQVTFTVAPDGNVSGLVLHQNGRDMPGTRVR